MLQSRLEAAVHRSKTVGVEGITAPRVERAVTLVANYGLAWNMFKHLSSNVQSLEDIFFLPKTQNCINYKITIRIESSGAHP